MSEADVLTARSALLDFHSDRATAFASLFFASIFGLVTTLAIIQGFTNEWLLLLSFLPYLAFALAGYYTYRKFVMYADIADKLMNIGLRKFAELWRARPSTEEEKEIYMKGKENLEEYINAVSKKMRESKIKGILRHPKVFSCLYWLLILGLAAIVYIHAFFFV